MPTYPIQLKRNGTAAATPSSLLHGEVALNYADGKLFWKDASNVIQSFTFQAYALSSHTHAASDITSGTLDAARLPLATTIAAGAVIVGTGLGVSSGTVSVTYGTSAGTACQGNDSRLSDARTPTSHSHGNITNAGAIGSTANLPIITTTSGVLTTGSFGTSAATFCEGNDSRLSDTRTPTDGSVTTAKIANDAVTYAKLQNVSATDRLLGRSSAGSGDVEEVTCTAAGRALLSGADAAAQRTTLSVQPTASPAFTGTVLVGISSALNSSDGVQVAAANNPGVTIARTAAPSNTNSIAGVNATSYDGAAYVSGATINFRAAENWSSTNHGTDIQFRTTPTGSGGSLTETLRLTGAGQLLVTAGSGSAGSYRPGVAVGGDDDTGLQQVGGANTISLVTQGSERVRVDASGNVLVGTTNTDPSFNNVSGVAIGTNYISMSRDNVCFGLNRSGTDGDIAVIRQDGVTEGSISVSGNTVSYNAFCGSHWAQLIDNSRPYILRGTVLETIDEMCEWPGEPKNDRLPRVKVSDTPRSRRVYGVFMAWDEDYAATGDMYATALGAYMVRVSGTVQAGDLLESAGDGTARTQPDDIVRSSTIGKVSSTHRVAEYDDGSYLVPCVLMCG